MSVLEFLVSTAAQMNFR